MTYAYFLHFICKRLKVFWTPSLRRLVTIIKKNCFYLIFEVSGYDLAPTQNVFKINLVCSAQDQVELSERYAFHPYPYYLF
jgi:hypothetical protein